MACTWDQECKCNTHWVMFQKYFRSIGWFNWTCNKKKKNYASHVIIPIISFLSHFDAEYSIDGKTFPFPSFSFPTGSSYVKWNNYYFYVRTKSAILNVHLVMQGKKMRAQNDSMNENCNSPWNKRKLLFLLLKYEWRIAMINIIIIIIKVGKMWNETWFSRERACHVPKQPNGQEEKRPYEININRMRTHTYSYIIIHPNSKHIISYINKYVYMSMSI